MLPNVNVSGQGLRHWTELRVMCSSSDFLPFIEANCSLPCYHDQFLSKITLNVLYDDDDDDDNNNNVIIKEAEKILKCKDLTI